MKTRLLLHRLPTALLILSAFFVLPVSHAVAANTYWTGGAGELDTAWDTPANWSSTTVPQDGDSAFLNLPGVSVIDKNTGNPTLGYLEIDATSGVDGSTLNQSKDDLTTNSMTVGNAGLGYYTQDATGSLLVNNNLTIGTLSGSVGQVLQNGGKISINGGSGALVLGRDDGAYGLYDLENGPYRIFRGENRTGRLR
jgi:hypothetical protein